MAFLDSNLDLSNTRFTHIALTNEHLIFARQFLQAAIDKHDPAWLRRPVGPLAVYWKDSGASAACYLIELSRTLSTLNKNVTKRSERIFVRKFRQLLRAKGASEYEDILTELQVACQLSDRISPISLSPLIPEDQIGAANEPPSPDYAVRLRRGDVFIDVFIEVTVLRFGVYLDWDSAVSQIASEISRLLRKRGASRIVYLRVPLALKGTDISKSELVSLVGQISSFERGRTAVSMRSTEIHAEWEPLPYIDTQGRHPKEMPPGVRYAICGPMGPSHEFGLMMASVTAADPEPVVIFEGAKPGPIPDTAIAVESRPIADDRLNNLLLKSLINTLKRKREQFPHTAPYVLVIKPGHHRIPVGTIADLLENRIWPKIECAWIGGICLFKPRTFSDVTDVPGSRTHDTPSSLVLFPNPKARSPLPQELVNVFEGQARYHMP